MRHEVKLELTNEQLVTLYDKLIDVKMSDVRAQLRQHIVDNLSVNQNTLPPLGPSELAAKIANDASLVRVGGLYDSKCYTAASGTIELVQMDVTIR